jgi:hypothetical protein
MDSETSVRDMDYFPGMTTKEFRKLHLAKSFFKKFEDRTQPNADDVALDKFLRSNIQCKNWSLRIESLRDELLIGLFKQEVYRFFNPKGDPLLAHFVDILSHSRTGPGASLLANGNDFYTKLFSSRLSCTSEALYLVYRHYFDAYPEWSAAETLRIDQFGEQKVVVGNRLSFVPKNADTSRVICTEPNLNMFFQLGLGRILEGRLRQFFGIDLACQQENNRDLARLGSISNNLSTIDLASASDTVSWGMMHELFPRDVLSWFGFMRSPSCTLPNGNVEELHMVSSMGNGFTFPLETIIFSCAVAASYYAADCRLIRPQGGNPGNFGVFGDDIIIEKQHEDRLVRLLHLLGFEVNAAKSFSEGPFRESCGGDYFNGHPVRGVYIKSLKTQANRFVAINRLNVWSAVSGIPLTRTIHRLVKSVRWLPVPLYENDDAGIRVPLEMVKHQKRDVDCQSILYRRWQSIPRLMKITDGGITVPKGARARMYNPHGLFLAFLRGDIVGCKAGGTIGIRLGPAKYHTKAAISPYWDWLPTVGRKLPIGLARLITAVSVNLNRF